MRCHSRGIAHLVRKVLHTRCAGQDCGVCQCALEVGEIMTRLPCGHAFHRECINKWLLEYSVTCPFKCSLQAS